MRSTFIVGLAVVLAHRPAAAQEVTLRAVSSFAEGTEFSRNFERFIEKVNGDGKGVIKINYIGGPRAVPPVRGRQRGAHRASSTSRTSTGAFYTNLMPEADGFKLNGKPMREQRKNGTWEYINQLHNQKLNSLLPRAPVPQRSVPHLSQQEDRQDRLLRPENPGDAGLQGRGRGARRHAHHHRARRGLHRARTRRGRRLRLADHRHFRSRLGKGDQVPHGAAVLQRRGQRAGEPRLVEESQRRAAPSCSTMPRCGWRGSTVNRRP